jgi:HEPN domain-containing protein
MKQHEQARLLFAKGCQDQALVDEVLMSTQVDNEIIGFHCQQAAEKFLKAVLSKVGVSFHRTHNLRQLMDLLADAGCAVPNNLDDLDALTPFGTTFRYDMLPMAQDFDRKNARDMVGRLRRWAEPKVTEDA